MLSTSYLRYHSNNNNIFNQSLNVVFETIVLVVDFRIKASFGKSLYSSSFYAVKMQLSYKLFSTTNA